MKSLLLVIFLLSICKSKSFAQCNWLQVSNESFEFFSVDPNVIPGVSYSSSPQQYPGCVHSGSNGMYLNFVDGYSGLVYKRDYTTFCTGSEYKISLFVRDTWGASNNCTYTVRDANGIVITSQSIFNSGNNWVNVVLNFTPSTPTISFEISTIMVGSSGNDLGVDDISLSFCKPLEFVFQEAICSLKQTADLFDSIPINSFQTNGVWTGPSNLSNGHFGSFNPLFNIEGTYKYSILNQCRDSSAYFKISSLEINAGNDTIICEGNAIVLSASGSVIYNWNNSVQNNIPFTPNITNQFIVSSVNTLGCSDQDSVLVTVNPSPTLSIGEDINICPNKEINLNATSTNVINWNLGVVNNIPFIPAQSNTYIASVLNEFGCIKTDSIFVNIYPSTEVFAGVDQNICLNRPVILNATGIGNFNWNNSIQNNVPFYPTETKEYTVISSNQFGCSDTDKVVVNILPLPVISAGNDIVVCDKNKIILNAEGAVDYQWNNGVIDGIPFLPNIRGIYKVIGTDINGCSSSDELQINFCDELLISEEYLFAPNAFTPDNDKFNNEWGVFLPNEKIYNFQIQIFNRWGTLIWESFQSENKWNGIYQENICQEGIFTWILSYNIYSSDIKIHKSGHINLIK